MLFSRTSHVIDMLIFYFNSIKGAIAYSISQLFEHSTIFFSCFNARKNIFWNLSFSDNITLRNDVCLELYHFVVFFSKSSFLGPQCHIAIGI